MSHCHSVTVLIIRESKDKTTWQGRYKIIQIVLILPRKTLEKQFCCMNDTENVWQNFMPCVPISLLDDINMSASFGSTVFVFVIYVHYQVLELCNLFILIDFIFHPFLWSQPISMTPQCCILETNYLIFLIAF